MTDKLLMTNSLRIYWNCICYEQCMLRQVLYPLVLYQ